MTQTGYDPDANMISSSIALSYTLQYCDLAISLLTPLMFVEVGDHAGPRCHYTPPCPAQCFLYNNPYMIMEE